MDGWSLQHMTMCDTSCLTPSKPLAAADVLYPCPPSLGYKPGSAWSGPGNDFFVDDGRQSW